MPKQTQRPSQDRSKERVFSSPIALAFIRRVQEKSGVSDAKARELYLAFLRKEKRLPGFAR